MTGAHTRPRWYRGSRAVPTDRRRVTLLMIAGLLVVAAVGGSWWAHRAPTPVSRATPQWHYEDEVPVTTSPDLYPLPTDTPTGPAEPVYPDEEWTEMTFRFPSRTPAAPPAGSGMRPVEPSLPPAPEATPSPTPEPSESPDPVESLIPPLPTPSVPHGKDCEKHPDKPRCQIAPTP